jgi:hypothetical protein
MTRGRFGDGAMRQNPWPDAIDRSKWLGAADLAWVAQKLPGKDHVALQNNKLIRLRNVLLTTLSSVRRLRPNKGAFYKNVTGI